MKKIYLLAIALVSTLCAEAQKETFNPIYTGVNSLDIAPDARGGALGDVGAATDPDVHSQYWNPAKYPFCISRSGVAFNYTPWLRQLVSDIDLAYVDGYYRIGDYSALSASLRYFSLGEVSA
ncbi:MAG: PorV/PorQ family protein, partial [Bacteroidaceae bacterium]|nr:PorV/PorQ family protein [Bacteroidaceae bacterium]